MKEREIKNEDWNRDKLKLRNNEEKMIETKKVWNEEKLKERKANRKKDWRKI